MHSSCIYQMDNKCTTWYRVYRENSRIANKFH